MIDHETLYAKYLISRRELIQKVGSTAVVLGASPLVLANSALAEPSRPAPLTEPPDVFKLFTLWLALTTNTTFKPFDKTVLANLTGFSETIAQAAIDEEKSKASTYDTVRTSYEALAKILAYGPGQCPKYIASLQPISKIPPL
jgi:hypothetical protein